MRSVLISAVTFLIPATVVIKLAFIGKNQYKIFISEIRHKPFRHGGPCTRIREATTPVLLMTFQRRSAVLRDMHFCSFVIKRWGKQQAIVKKWWCYQTSAYRPPGWREQTKLPALLSLNFLISPIGLHALHFSFSRNGFRLFWICVLFWWRITDGAEAPEIALPANSFSGLISILPMSKGKTET